MIGMPASLGVLDRHAGRGGAGRDVDDRVDLLGDEVLDLVDLGGGVAAGVGDDDLDALLGRLLGDGLLDLVEEVGLQVGHREADLAACPPPSAGRRSVARPRITTIGPMTKNVERDMAQASLRRSTSSMTASAMTTPMTTCWTNGETLIRLSPLRRTPMISTPSAVPVTVPTPPLSAGAADHDGGDRVELVARGGARLGGVQAHGEDHGGDAGEQAGGGVDGDRQPAWSCRPARRATSALPPSAYSARPLAR